MSAGEEHPLLRAALARELVDPGRLAAARARHEALARSGQASDLLQVVAQLLSPAELAGVRALRDELARDPTATAAGSGEKRKETLTLGWEKRKETLTLGLVTRRRASRRTSSCWAADVRLQAVHDRPGCGSAWSALVPPASAWPMPRPRSPILTPRPRSRTSRAGRRAR